MKKLIVAVAVFVIVLNLNLALVRAAQWDFLMNMPPDCTYYIESSSLFCDELRDNEIIFHAFLKSVYTAEGRKKLLKRFMDNHGYLPEGAANITHSIFLEYFKWSNGIKYYCIDSESICRSDGSIVQEMSYERSWHNWQVAKPGARADLIFDAVSAILIAKSR